VGSLEAGKKADLVLLDLDRVWNPYGGNDLYSAIVYSGTPENVHSVMADGWWVYRDRHHTTLDAPLVVENAREELRLLLQRVH
jgi:5-methylthioadenosine/S-adenosylhomocysteine deaminase